jgi:hypothetical protein
MNRRHILIGALVLVGAIVAFRVIRARRKPPADNSFAGGAGVFMPIPVSFSYLQSNAGTGQPTDSVALNNAGLALLGQLTDALLSFAPNRNGVPASVGVSPSASAPSSYVPHPITVGGQTYMGQLTEGGKGETEFFRTKAEAVGGVLEWKGPGRYTRIKFPGTAPGGRDTEWVFAGA